MQGDVAARQKSMLAAMEGIVTPIGLRWVWFISSKFQLKELDRDHKYYKPT
jgi:hypothetical protein